MPRRSRPQAALASLLLDLDLCFLPEWRVKTATPAVTAATTRYL